MKRDDRLRSPTPWRKGSIECAPTKERFDPVFDDEPDFSRVRRQQNRNQKERIGKAKCHPNNPIYASGKCKICFDHMVSQKHLELPVPVEQPKPAPVKTVAPKPSQPERTCYFCRAVLPDNSADSLCGKCANKPGVRPTRR